MRKALIALCIALIGLAPITTLAGTVVSPSVTTTTQPSAIVESNEVIDWAAPQLDGFYQTLFLLQGQTDYRAPKVTIVPPGATVYTACGHGSSPMLALYCFPGEEIVISQELIDLLADEDEFLPAYVLAHEWAHHAQYISGTGPVYMPQPGDWDQVYTIENELRADCMSGVWMRSVAERGFLNATDIPAVLITASEIGDSGLTGRGHSHGYGVERLRAVFLGYEEGMMGCMAITPMVR
jgi:predicted metalloprotease